MKVLIDFLQELVKLARLSLQSSGEKEEVLKAYEWLEKKTKDTEDTEVQDYNKAFLEPGKIYVFKYEPAFKERYAYYDEHPVVLALGKMPSSNGAMGFMNVGINISWYPPKARKYIVEKIRKLYESKYKDAIQKSPMKANDQNRVDMDLFALKMALDKFGLSFAVRSYFPEKMKSPRVCIAYEHWDKAIQLDQPGVFPEIEGKATIMQIYKDFEDYVKYCQKNQGERLKKMDAAKKLNKYKFIK